MICQCERSEVASMVNVEHRSFRRAFGVGGHHVDSVASELYYET